MQAVLLRHDRYVDVDGDLVELVLWQVPRTAAYPDGIRYRLAFLLAGTEKPTVLYDTAPKATIDTLDQRRPRTPSPRSISSWRTFSRTFSV